MADENSNQIERTGSGGSIRRRSDAARLGMNAANYVSGLGVRQDADLQGGPTTAEYTYEFLRKWGTRGGGDGQFVSPVGLAIDGDDNVYVLDAYQIQVFDPQGQFLRKWGARSDGDGQFALPQFLAIDREGNVYAADGDNHRIQVFDPQGQFLRKWGTYGKGDGQFNLPLGLAIDREGNVYVADVRNHRIQVFKRVPLSG